MGQGNIEQHRRYITMAYLFMFFALFTVICAAVAYLLARKIAMVDDTEVWLHAHALWIMRNVLLFALMAAFAALWFIPLYFFAWDSTQWVKGMTVAGVTFSAVAWLFLLNAWFKGMAKYLKNKAVF